MCYNLRRNALTEVKQKIYIALPASLPRGLNKKLKNDAHLTAVLRNSLSFSPPAILELVYLH